MQRKVDNPDLIIDISIHAPYKGCNKVCKYASMQVF